MISTTASTVRELLDPNVPTFVLIDPMAGEPIALPFSRSKGDHINRRDTAWGRISIPIHLHERTKLLVELQPYLIALNGKNDPMLNASFQLAVAEREDVLQNGFDKQGAVPHSIGGWIQSAQHPAEIVKTLAGLMYVDYNDFIRATYLRLADRRVFALLRYVIGDIRLSQALGPIGRWIYLDPRGHVEKLESQEETSTRLTLDRVEWNQLKRGEAVQRTLVMWQCGAARLGDHSIERLPAPMLYETVLKAILTAQEASRRWPSRFSRPSDQFIWAALRLIYGDRLDQSDVSDLMAESIPAGAPDSPMREFYADLLPALEESRVKSPSLNATGETRHDGL